MDQAQGPQTGAAQPKKGSSYFKKSRSAGGGRPGPGPTFVSKLYKMLSDPTNARLITWTPPGDAFVVLRPSEFARKLLPTQYKHSQFQSFVRQANMYGFSKITLPTAVISQLLAAGESTHPASHSLSQLVRAPASSNHANDASPPLPSTMSSPRHAPATITSTPTTRDVPHTEASASRNGAASSSAPPPPRSTLASKASAPDELPWAFKHPKFMRGAVDLLPEVRRKARVRRLSVSATGSPVSSTAAVRGLGKRSPSQDQRQLEQDAGGDYDYQSGANDGDSDGEGAASPCDGVYYGHNEEGDRSDERKAMMDMPSSTSLMMGGSSTLMGPDGEYSNGPLAAASRHSGHFSLHHSHHEQFVPSASPGLRVDTMSNEPHDDRPSPSSYAHSSFPYPLPPRPANVTDHYAGPSATVAMFRLAELTSKLADMVTRSLPPDDESDATVIVRNEVTNIVNEAWGIADAFAGSGHGGSGTVAAAAAESATGIGASSLSKSSQDPLDHGHGTSQALPPIHAPAAAPMFPPQTTTSADSLGPMRHPRPGWDHPSTYPSSTTHYRQGPPRAYPGRGPVYSSGFSRPSPYPPANSARDAYMSPPYTSHPSFSSHPSSRSPADMYWPDPMHFPHSPTHPPAHYNTSSPAGASYSHVSFPPPSVAPIGGYSSSSHVHALPPPPIGRYYPPLVPASGLRYFSSAADGREGSGVPLSSADDAERQIARRPTANEEYEMAMTQEWQN